LKGLILCRFDQVLGPTVLLKYPKSLEDKIIQKFSSLMDIHDEGFFIHSFENYKTANITFQIQSEYARGKKEFLQISLILNRENKIDESILQKSLEEFVNIFLKIENLYYAFYTDKFHGNNKKMEELKKVFYTFSKSIRTGIKALNESEIKYKTLFESARDAIIIFNLQTGTIVDYNNYTKKIIKLDETLPNISNIRTLLSIQDYQRFKNKIDKLILDDNIDLIELEILNLNNRAIPVEINANKLCFGEQELTQLIIRDISKRKQLEFRLNERIKELKALYKISTLFEKKKISISDLLNECLEIIISALRYPNIGCIRIIYNNNQWNSKNFKETKWKIATHIKIEDKILDIEIFYLKDRDFLEEKLDFIYDIAKKLKIFFQNKIN